MTKNFCDMCGELATGQHTDARYPILEKKWSGTLCRPNSPNPTDGTWVPEFWVYMKFEAEYLTKEKPGRITPDLCAKCIAKILQAMIDGFKYKNGL